MTTPDTTISLPGKAYEILIKARFTKSSDVQAKAVTRALKTGDRRNKGRGYRVFVTLNKPKACFLAAYMHEYIASPAYRGLGSADALAIRTLRDRFDAICAPSPAQVSRAENLTKAREQAAANREVAAAPRIEKALAAARAFSTWSKRDALITQLRNAGHKISREPLPPVTAAQWKDLKENAPNWDIEPYDTPIDDLLELTHAKI